MSAPYYAQRKEDRKIEKLLDLFFQVPPYPSRSNGTYIDVGAWDPTVDSVTKHFYDKGWSGINIEPVPYYFDLFPESRVRDINLCLAISEPMIRGDDGREFLEYVRDFHYIEGTGLSTFDEENVIRGSGSHLVHEISVTVWTLAQVFRHCLSPHQQTNVDFLKVDVEGHEREVLIGNDWDRFRPKVLCIEATIPGTEIPAWESWDQFVRDQRYDFLEFDGLNRYYVRQEK